MEVYYMKNKYAELMINTYKITLENLYETHVKIPVLFPVTVKTPDDIFAILNVDISNPLSQNQ